MSAMQFTPHSGFATGQMSNALDVLLIMLGGRCFGLPLENVNHICQLPPTFASYGDEVESHFVFQGNPFPFLSLWNLLGLKSEYLEYEEMQTMLRQRRQDHLDWMNALEDSIKNATPFSKARNPHDCAFGKWYYGYRTKNLRLTLLMNQFEQPHAEIHCLADRLLKLVESGQASTALRLFQASKSTTLVELLELFDLTQTTLAALQRRIAIIMTNGNDACVLGADSIREIVSAPADSIKPSTGAMAASATTALIVLEDGTVAPLINWCAFSFNTSEA